MLCVLHDGLPHNTLMPSKGKAAVVDAAFETVNEQGTIVSTLADIFFSRPDDLNRAPLALGRLNGFNNIIRGLAGAPTEATAHQRSVNHHL